MLTAQQVENWRKVLLGMIGPIALLLPASEIQRLKDAMQRDIDQEGERLSQQRPRIHTGDHYHQRSPVVIEDSSDTKKDSKGFMSIGDLLNIQKDKEDK